MKIIKEFYTNVAHQQCDTGDKIIYPFGPPIFQTEVDEEFVKELLDEGKKLKDEDDWSMKLAGNFKQGRSFKYKEEYTLKAEKYLLGYLNRFIDNLHKFNSKDWIKNMTEVPIGIRKYVQGEYFLDALWINYQYKNDFNPQHIHSGKWSFVIFCKVPEKIFSVQANSNSQQAGEIVFSFGDKVSEAMSTNFPVKPFENLMFIFPSNLEHYVPPFWVDEERISVSGNFLVKPKKVGKRIVSF